MKKFIDIIFKGKLIILILLLIGFLTGFLIAYNFTHDTGVLEFNFRYVEDVNIDENNIISTESINKVKEIEYSYYTGSYISTYKDANITFIDIKETNNTYKILVNVDAFKTESSAKGFLKHLAIISLDESYYNSYSQYTRTEEKNGYTVTIEGITKIFDNDFYETNSLDSNSNLLRTTDNNRRNSLIKYSIISSIIGFIVGLVLVIILGYLNKINIIHEYDNKNTFKNPFKKEFFKSSNIFKDLRALITISILLGFVMVFKFIPIPSGFGSLGITFGFLFLATASMIYGPFPALAIGFLSDTIGFIIKPDGPFFPGYTLNAMLACFTYAMCFYKTHITFTRVLISRTFVNIIINSILGSLWHVIINKIPMNQYVTYVLFTSLPKNIAYLIPQTIILFIVLKCVLPVLKSTNHINNDITVTLF